MPGSGLLRVQAGGGARGDGGLLGHAHILRAFSVGAQGVDMAKPHSPKWRSKRWHQIKRKPKVWYEKCFNCGQGEVGDYLRHDPMRIVDDEVFSESRICHRCDPEGFERWQARQVKKALKKEAV